MFSPKILFRTFLAGLVIILWYSCKKTNDVEVVVDTPSACFTTLVRQRFYSNLLQTTTVLIDSTVYFKNCSDSSATISYRWDFGDGTSSDLKNPSHKYTDDGKYIVTLVTTEKDLAFDTAKVEIQVAVGQKSIVSTGKISNSAIDIQENGDEFVLLGTRNDQAVFPYVYNYYVSRLDRKLNVKNTKIYPATTRFSAFCLGDNGGLVLTGATSPGSINNEIIKTGADGSIISTRVVGTLNNYVCISKSQDDGYFLLGTRAITQGNQREVNVLVKTDKDGNVSWEKVFDNDIKISTANNLVAENDGVVLAGLKMNQRTTPGCSYCDSVIIVKYSNTGSVAWKNTVEWSVNSDNFFNTRIAKLQNGGYVVNNSNVKAIFFFSFSGQFTDRKLLSANVNAIAVSATGSIAALMQEWGNGFRAATAGLSSEGVVKWNAGIDGTITGPNGSWGCCFDSWPVIVRELKRGGTIVVANIVNSQQNYIYVPALLKLDDKGKQL